MMKEWNKGLILFTSMLTPLVFADWQLDIDFELASRGISDSAQTSVMLVPGEETLLFDKNTTRGNLIAKAELLNVTEEQVTVSLLIQELNAGGSWRTIMSPVVNARLNNPALIKSRNELLDESALLKVSISV